MSTTHALNRALVVAAAAMLVAGVAATTPAVAAQNDPAPPSAAIAAIDKGGAGQGPSVATAETAAGTEISRSEVIQRAASWVGLGLVYNWNGRYQGYRTDCSGYVSMAWNLAAPGLDTTSFVPNGVASWITKDDLKPGDALLNDAALANGHIALFAGWTDSSRTSYHGYEFTGTGVHYRTIPYPYFPGYGTFKPVRNNSIVDDVVDPGPDNVGVYRPSTHEFHLRNDDGSLRKIGWGTVGDRPVSGNWDGVGPDNVGIYRPSTREFHLRNDDGSLRKVGWGTVGDVPVSGNWDGGSADNVGIWRPSTHQFHLRKDDGSLLAQITWGDDGDIPVSGNWDGGHADNVGVYRPSTREFHLRMDDGSLRKVGYGTVGDLPVSGDWDGTGPENLGVWRPGSHQFHLRAADGSLLDQITWGDDGDIPVSGNWDARS
ncbi:hypothetical protein [Streptomyces sp. enrichment culture]|uniref:hypothetical protein n=1 Tax=Streptomyces sp. enrichment culture TaxID=1795815 RepID=UPI003F565477